MFSEKDLQALLDYSAESPVLSVYLNTDPTAITTEAAKIRLRNLMKTVDLPEDVMAVEAYINLEYDWAAKGVVIFSSHQEDYFQTYQFNLSVPDKVFVGDRPVIRPLAHLTETFTGWSVVLVDKEKSRMFSFNLGELVEVEGLTGEGVKQIKRGGGDAMLGRKGGSSASGNVEKIIEQNMKEMVDFATEFFTAHHIRRIMIGGTDENVARFKEELPKAWQSLVVGEFPMSMTANSAEVLEKATQEAIAANLKVIDNLVEKSITMAASGGIGATGLIDTLNAIHEGRVKTLLVLEDFEEAGFRCGGCGYLTTQSLEKCPFCGGQFDRIDSAVEMAVQEALQKGADVKILEENGQLAKAGSITAIMRY